MLPIRKLINSYFLINIFGFIVILWEFTSAPNNFENEIPKNLYKVSRYESSWINVSLLFTFRLDIKNLFCRFCLWSKSASWNIFRDLISNNFERYMMKPSILIIIWFRPWTFSLENKSPRLCNNYYSLNLVLYLQRFCCRKISWFS